MAKVIKGEPATLEKVAKLERDFGVKVSYKSGSNTAYIVEGKNSESFLNAVLGIEGVEELENNY